MRRQPSLRQFLAFASLLFAFFVALPSAHATHLRGGTLSWKVISTTSMTYTVQFTFTESQRWDYPSGDGTSLPVGHAVTLVDYSNGTFYFGDGANTTTAPGTITSVNQAQDYATATFVFTHTYTIAGGAHTAYFLASNRISTLKIGADIPEEISTYVQNYANGSPTASEPAILSVPIQNTVTFNIGTAVTDIDPNANVVFRLSTIAEVYGPSVTSVPCPSGVAYTQGNPPGFTVSAAGVVTWDTTQIVKAVTSGNCHLSAPVAGDLWTAQVIAEAHDKTTNALLSSTPVDLLMEFVNAVGDLPTISAIPPGTQTVEIGTPVTFNVTGNSANTGAKVTLNASGVPQGANVTGLNATVTPPAMSDFTWTPNSTQAGTYVVTFTVTDSNLQQAQVSETIVVENLPTISCSSAISVAYGSTGQFTATLTDPNSQLLNVVWSVDGTPVQTDNGIQGYPTAATDTLNQTYGNVGSHSISATATDPQGVQVSCMTSANVTPAPITVTGGSGTAVYNGSVQTPSACTVAGPYTGDVSCTNQPSTVGPDAGTTAIVPVPSSANLGNYAITLVDGSFTVMQASTNTIVSCPATVTYNGTPQTPCTVSVTGVGLAPQSPTISYSLNTNVGMATASASFAGDMDHLVSSGSTNFNIAPAPLTVTAGSYSGVYDSNTHALSGCTVSANFDHLTCTNSPAGPVGPDVGSATVTPVVSNSTSNYTVTTNNGSWSITPLSVNVAAGSYSAVYDGNAHAIPACTSSFAGVTCSDSPSVVGPGAGSGMVTPSVSLISGIAPDYAINPQNGAWSITQATSAVTVTCPATPVTYNGLAQTPCTANVTGVGGLSQTLSVTYTANVGVGQATASATYAGDANHTGSNNSSTFNIAAALLTVTAGSYSGTYDGNAHALSACVVSANPDNLTCTNNPAGQVGPNVGSAVVTPVLSGSAANYNVQTNSGSWSITPLNVTVTAGSLSGTYNGAAQSIPACVSSYAGVTCADSVTSVGPGVGSGTINPVVGYATGTAADYSITAQNGTYTIGKRSASVTPNPATKVFGTTDPALSGTLAGFLPADGIVAVYSRTVGESVASSPYTISATLSPLAALANYAVTYNTAAFTITKATPTITWGTPAAINSGTPLSATQLNATANVPGTFLYTPGLGAVLLAGTDPLSVTFTPNDSSDYNNASANNLIVVNGTGVSLGVPSGTQTYPTWTNFVLGPLYTGSRVPTGTVTLYNNGVAIITLTLGGDGKAYYTTQPPLNAGVNNLTVSYSGDAHFPPGLSAVTTITVLPAPVNFQATCEGAQVYTQQYRCQVNLSSDTSTPPIGSITYSFDGGAATVVAINSGNAPFVVPGIPSAGPHTLVISYAGQGNYAAAASLSRPFTTQPGQTELQVYPSTYYTAHGSSLTLSGSAVTPSSGVPPGVVTFYDNGSELGTANVGSNGAVSYPVTNVAKGQHSYSASFAPSSTNYTTANSGTSTITAY